MTGSCNNLELVVSRLAGSPRELFSIPSNESNAMNKLPDTSDNAYLEASRRQKMDQLVELGVDPWGGRFDDRTLVGDIRERAGEIKYRKEDGTLVAMPEEVEEEGFNFRQWLAEQGPGELIGPKVRAAGRVMLKRDTGKLKFIDIKDWTGKLQLFVGRNQVGDENWKVCECVDLGDLIGVDGDLRRTKTGELSIFASEIHFLGKSLDPPPAKHQGLVDAEQRQRQRYVDLAYNDGVLERFMDRIKVVQSIRTTLSIAWLC